MTPHDVAELLLSVGAVALNTKEPFRYSSGLLSPIYCDNRVLISYPEERRKIIRSFLSHIEDEGFDFDTVGGTSTAGIPHAAWIAQNLECPMVYIRGKAKGHGKKKQVEGVLNEGDTVLVIEDLVSTGGSSLEAVEGIRNEGGVVHEVLAIFSYGMESAVKGFEEAEVTLHTLTNFEMLIEVAIERGDISEDDKEKVLEWNRDPQGWGKKMGYE